MIIHERLKELLCRLAIDNTCHVRCVLYCRPEYPAAQNPMAV
jgi:hypothetical protein